MDLIYSHLLIPFVCASRSRTFTISPFSSVSILRCSCLCRLWIFILLVYPIILSICSCSYLSFIKRFLNWRKVDCALSTSSSFVLSFSPSLVAFFYLALVNANGNVGLSCHWICHWIWCSCSIHTLYELPLHLYLTTLFSYFIHFCLPFVFPSDNV